MAITKDKKKEILKSLVDKIEKSKSVVFAVYNGLTVKENEELRQQLSNENSEYYVVKKTLINLAFKNKNIEGLDAKKFDGQVATIFGYEDEVAPAKIISEFIKTHKDKVEFAGGVLENKYMNKDEVTRLSMVPGKQELYAKIVGSINAPVSGFVNVLAGNIRNFVNVLKAVEEKKS